MGVGHELFAIRNFESFLTELPKWDLERDQAFRLSWVLEEIRKNSDRSLQLSEYETRLYHPRVIAFAEEVLWRNPDVLDRTVSLGRRWRRVAVALAQVIDDETAEAIVFGDQEFGRTSRVVGGARHTTSERCVELCDVLESIDAGDFVSSIDCQAVLADDGNASAKSKADKKAVAALRTQLHSAIVSLDEFYADVVANGDAVIGIRD